MKLNFRNDLKWVAVMSTIGVIASVAIVTVLANTGVLTTKQASEIKQDVGVLATAIAEIAEALEPDATPVSYSYEVPRNHPIYDGVDNPPAHDPSHDSRPQARDVLWQEGASYGKAKSIVDNAQKYTPSVQDVAEAHSRSWIREARPEFLNNAGATISKADFLELLRYSPTAEARYVAQYQPATDDSEAVYKWECLDYASAMKSWLVSLGIYSVGFVLDLTGHHSYNTVVVFDTDVNLYVELVVEPQGNVVVPRAYPQHHYVGDDKSTILYY